MAVRNGKNIMLIFSCLIQYNPVFTQNPGVRNGHSMVFNSPDNSIILFGGADEKKVYGDTWSYSNGKWKRITEKGPSPRTFPGLVMADNYILLFGGNSVLFGNKNNPVHYLEDTWKFQYGKWEKIKVKIHPSARGEVAIGYDHINKKVILFGGRMTGNQWIADDTWEFDGNIWKQKKVSGPTARSGAVMAYYPPLKGLVLYGGNPVIAKKKDYNGPMWLWNGNKWRKIDSDVPLIFNSCMACDPSEKILLRFGGWTGEKRINETWIYKNSRWIEQKLTIVPPARNHSVLVYDPQSNSFLLYGGHDGEFVFGDLWRFKDANWSILSYQKPIKRIENGH